MFKTQTTIMLTVHLFVFAVATAYGQEDRNAETPAAVDASDGVRLAQAEEPPTRRPAAPQPVAKDCCQVFKPKGCPPAKPCHRDACVTIQITPIDKQDANFTYNGTNSFMNIFGAAVARGAENATIRAMNAIKVCPNCTQHHEGECDPAEAAATSR